MNKHFISISALLAFVSAHASWSGLPPDCWPQPRNTHATHNVDSWEKKVVISKPKAEKPKPGVFSPNKGYYFIVRENPNQSEATIRIYAEKDYLIQIKFNELSWLSETRWINEKLLFIRPWWGKIVGTDIIYDVEKEKIIYAETITDGSIAYAQFRESCPQQGCKCIKRK